MSVMNVKQSTKAFGDNQGNQRASAVGPSEYTPAEMKQLGGENVGEVLNKVADPNWVDPTRKARTAGNDKLDKDAFFKLMLAQMKNQDPTNPLKSHEMAAQLANFSSLEQMQNVNATLTEMKNGQKPLEQFQALNFIGKAVSGDSSKIARARGDKDHDFRFTLPSDATSVDIKLKNADGDLVKTFNLKNLKAGENKLSWNGIDDKGNKAPAGDYQFSPEAVGGTGQKMAVKTQFDGIITGVNYSAEGPVLLVGNQSIRMRDVKKITDPSLMKNDQKMQNVATPDLKVDNAMKQTEENDTGAPDAPQNTVNNLMNRVGHSPAMMSKLVKETKE